ncbi:MAG TPA: NAD-dependent epimerase/dehydratase family protein [Jatrophihabitans sp.]|nr:NAD-dependent epimerase/dehydratase family protein [Jatrophihabitans sp.]
MRCLVLGGSSFVGGRLVARLLEEGHDTAVLNRGRTAGSRPGVTQLVADRRDPDTMRAALRDREWDAVFDVSGYIMATDAANFTALVDLLDGRTGRYVFVSSVMAYQFTGFFPWPETAPVTDDPPTTYGGFKAFAEKTLVDRFASSGLPATVARPAAIYGPENNIYDMESAMFLRLRRSLPILLPHEGLVVNSFGHVDELAAALLVLATHPGAPGEIFNISGVGVTAAQYVRALADIVGVEPDIRLVPDEVAAKLDRPAYCRLFKPRHHSLMDLTKARSVLGLPPERSFREGHEQTYEWFLGSPLADARVNLDDPLWGKGFDLAYEAEVAQQLDAGR